MNEWPKWHVRPGSRNPFHSRWYNVAALFQPLYRLFGFTLCLRECRWTKSRAALALAFVGW